MVVLWWLCLNWVGWFLVRIWVLCLFIFFLLLRVEVVVGKWFWLFNVCVM